MNEDHAAGVESLIDETADRRHPNEKIFVMRILNWDTHVSDARLRVLGRNGFSANRDDMSDAAFC
jgi:hypothetical protein